VLGHLGIYATYIAAALVSLLIVADGYVLLGHPSLVGLLALLVVTGPLVAMLLSTFASWTNYYGIWRILRGIDEYSAGQDLKSHAADIPQAVQALLAGRRGCLPAVSVALLFVSLVLAGAANMPPETPGIGALGTWQDHRGAGGIIAPTATPTTEVVIVEATATAAPTATATTRPTATATARPIVVPTATATATATATPTPTPPPVMFKITPPSDSYSSCATSPSPPKKTPVLDNSQSTVAVSWQASARERLPNGAPWATITDANGNPLTQGTIPAGKTQPITVVPAIRLCSLSPSLPYPWHIDVVVTGVGTFTYTYTMS
jgi:hypothetical protein